MNTHWILSNSPTTISPIHLSIPFFLLCTVTNSGSCDLKKHSCTLTSMQPSLTFHQHYLWQARVPIPVWVTVTQGHLYWAVDSAPWPANWEQPRRDSGNAQGVGKYKRRCGEVGERWVEIKRVPAERGRKKGESSKRSLKVNGRDKRQKKLTPLSLVPQGQPHASASLPHTLDTCLELYSNSLSSRLTRRELSTHTAVALWAFAKRKPTCFCPRAEFYLFWTVNTWNLVEPSQHRMAKELAGQIDGARGWTHRLACAGLRSRVTCGPSKMG